MLKGLVALGGIYLLFIIEHCIRMFKHYKQQRVSVFTPVIRYSSNGQLLFWNMRFSLAWCYVYFLPTLSLPLTCVASSLCVLWHLSRGLAVSETAPFHHTYD